MIPSRIGAALALAAALCPSLSSRLQAEAGPERPALVPHAISDSGTYLSPVGPGDVVVTEFMKDPSAVSDTNGEWIEIHNNLPWRVDVEGMVVRDAGTESFVLDNGGAGILIGPGGYFVLGRNADPSTNGGVQVDFQYSGFTLANSSDQILLATSVGFHLDTVRYDDGVNWPDTAGHSISLDPAVLDPDQNDDASLWCEATSVYGGGDAGTPGSMNDDCP